MSDSSFFFKLNISNYAHYSNDYEMWTAIKQEIARVHRQRSIRGGSEFFSLSLFSLSRFFR